MKLREITRELIKLLEEKSGYPVQVLENPKLATLSTIRIARNNVPGHTLYYCPSPGMPPDYAICWQCAFAMRMFECPPEERVQISASSAGEKIVESLIANGIGQKMHLSHTQLASLNQQVLLGLVTLE